MLICCSRILLTKLLVDQRHCISVIFWAISHGCYTSFLAREVCRTLPCSEACWFMEFVQGLVESVQHFCSHQSSPWRYVCWSRITQNTPEEQPSLITVEWSLTIINELESSLTGSITDPSNLADWSPKKYHWCSLKEQDGEEQTHKWLTADRWVNTCNSGCMFVSTSDIILTSHRCLPQEVLLLPHGACAAVPGAAECGEAFAARGVTERRVRRWQGV